MITQEYCEDYTRTFVEPGGARVEVYVYQVNALIDEDGNAFDHTATLVRVTRTAFDGPTETFVWHDVDAHKVNHRPFIGGAILDTMADAIEAEGFR